MAEKQGRGKGKHQQKFDRKRKRSASQQRYRMECRSYKNKLRRAKAYANKFGTTVIIKGIDGKLEKVKPSV